MMKMEPCGGNWFHVKHLKLKKKIISVKIRISLGKAPESD